MMLAVSRAMMALAVCCFGDHRREWACAMQAEFETAIMDRKPLAFALGCLTAAWREMPSHEEGRFALANHAIALALIVPIAALFLSGVFLGFPYSYSGHAIAHGLWAGSREGHSLLNDANQGVAPTMALLALFLSGVHFVTAWAMLERNWTIVGVMAKMNLATTVTVILFNAIVFLDEGWSLFSIFGIIIEFPMILYLIYWSRKLQFDEMANFHSENSNI